jgi:hypothetical protein
MHLPFVLPATCAKARLGTFVPWLPTLVGGGLALFLTGCIEPGEPPALGELSSASTVASYETSSCSTGAVLGLSRQIADEVGCIKPGSLVAFTATPEVVITGSSVMPYLAPAARDELFAAASGTKIEVNSAFRTVAQQFLLYRWYQAGRCGVPIAATPGTSNHESGRALDVANYAGLITTLSRHGWAHDVAGDPVHFDHLGSADLAGQDVLAFQRLWNRNHPSDLIAEDGGYGPMTEARLRASPAGGFPLGASCLAPPTRHLAVVAVVAPPTLASGALGHVAITLRNDGQVAWPATTRLVTADGQQSALFDPASWLSATEVATLGAGVAIGGEVTVELDVLAPSATGETPIAVELELADGAARFGAIPLAFTVIPDGGGGGGGTGGCAAGGGGAWWLALAALALSRRRR